MHIYTCDDGTELPSVTTILSILGSESLLHWANFLGFRHMRYEDELERRAEIGTIIHECLRSVVDPSAPTKVVEFKNSFDTTYFNKITENFKAKIGKLKYETIFTEKELISKTLGFGGTLDWLCKIDNLLMLNDFKSSKRARMTHFLQLGGYNLLLKEQGYDIDCASIIICNINKCEMYPIGKEELSKFSEDFLILVDLFKRLDGGNYYPSENIELKRFLFKNGEGK